MAGESLRSVGLDLGNRLRPLLRLSAPPSTCTAASCVMLEPTSGGESTDALSTAQSSRPEDSRQPGTTCVQISGSADLLVFMVCWMSVLIAVLTQIRSCQLQEVLTGNDQPEGPSSGLIHSFLCTLHLVISKTARALSSSTGVAFGQTGYKLPSPLQSLSEQAKNATKPLRHGCLG